MQLTAILHASAPSAGYLLVLLHEGGTLQSRAEFHTCSGLEYWTCSRLAAREWSHACRMPRLILGRVGPAPAPDNVLKQENLPLESALPRNAPECVTLSSCYRNVGPDPPNASTDPFFRPNSKLLDPNLPASSAHRLPASATATSPRPPRHPTLLHNQRLSLLSMYQPFSA